jgi:acetyltransferase-like isoleucine patch superfamily enzyme
MKGFIKLVSGVLHRITAIRRRKAALEKLRTDNPGCTIMSPDIYDSLLGKSVAIHEGTMLYQVRMGDFSYVSGNSNLNNVNVGNFCSIGQHVRVGLSPHPSRIFVSTYPAFYSNDNEGCPKNFREDKIFDDSVPKTEIASDVWIGFNVIIPGGITIGTGAIVAAGSVVVKDIPPFAVVGGNPAQIIRYRFSEEQISLLQESKWWDWPIEKIHQHLDDFSDVEKFLKQ